MLYKCSVCIFGDRVNFSTDCKNAYDVIIGLKDYFYNDNFSIDDYDISLKYEIQYIDSAEQSELLVNDNIYMYIDTWKDIFHTKQLQSIIYQVVDVVRQESNRFLLHASAISTKYGAVVFVGDSGVGKTSLMLRLCLKNNFKMISNDRVVIGKKDDIIYVERGSKYLNLRKSSIDTYLPEISNVFGNQKVADWDNKKVFFPEDIGLLFETNRTNLYAIIGINIIDNWNGAPDFYILPAKIGERYKWSDIMYINDIFSKSIRGEEHVAVSKTNKINENFFMPLLDNKISSYNRKQFINYIIENEKIFRLRSDMEFAEKVILNVLNIN